MEGQVDVKMKVVYAGQTSSGKTTLISWEVQRVLPSFQFMVFNDFKKKTYQIGDIAAEVQIWDIVGGQKFMTLKGSLYRTAHAICVCFSLNDRRTFEKVPVWMKALRSYEVECPLFLVGCKADLEHVVPLEEIMEYASKEGMTYFETSSNLDKGVTDNIQKAMEAAYGYYRKNPPVRLKAETKPIKHNRFNGFCWT